MRARLPNRRECDRLRFDHNGIAFDAAISRNTAGELAEVFLTPSAKSGTAIGNFARDLAVVASNALQHGAGADELRHALTRADDGSAAGPLGQLLDRLAGEPEKP